MRKETTLKRCEDATHSHSASRKSEPRSFYFAKLWECARVLAPLLLLVSSAVFGADDKPLWQIQKVHSLETYILSTNHYQIELLTNLDQVPEAGALVVVSFPKPKGGSGFPARVFAILP